MWSSVRVVVELLRFLTRMDAAPTATFKSSPGYVVAVATLLVPRETTSYVMIRSVDFSNPSWRFQRIDRNEYGCSVACQLNGPYAL
jgi:hypothetical protein